MDILARAYDDDSSTPKLEQIREDSYETSPQYMLEGYRKRMDSGSSLDKASKKSGKRPSSTTSVKDSDSDSSDSDEDSTSDGELKNTGIAARRSSESSAISSASSSPSGSGRSDVSKKSDKEKEVTLKGRDRKPSSSSKVSSRRSRSRSGSKGRRRRRSSERHRRSRSRDRHHKSSRSERRSGRRSRSRSRDRHARHHGRDHRRRDSHRRRRSSSRDGHRHRHRSSPNHRRRRHSRSPDHKKSHRSEKRRRSRSPLANNSAKTEESGGVGVISAPAAPVSSRPPVFKVAGVKFKTGRGTSTNSFKDVMREEYRQNVLRAQDLVEGKGQPQAPGPVPLMSSVATVSAGTAVLGSGGLGQALVNQMQMLQQQQQSHYLPGQPGCLTAEQKELNQKFILQSTGRTREQVEAQFGVKISPVYNEATNNLVELAQREKKRGLLWKNSDKKKNEGNSAFNAVPILPGQSRSENQKFARLLGCRKGEPKAVEEPETTEDQAQQEAEQKAFMENEILNHNLEREFESSRRFTHFNRGVGLGYSTTMYQPH